MRVALDVTPLRGAPTGVGQAVQGLVQALPAAAPGVEVVPWELTRASMPVPPSVLVRLWARLDRPRADRWLPDADVVHGTNFVVPPSRRPSTVTVHDCWCVRSPRSCHATVAAATATVRRAVDRGVWLHVSTEWGATEVRELYGAERVVVVPFGVPAVAEAPGPPPVDGPYVLALGDTDDPRKGHDVLGRALAELPDVRLVVAGGAPGGGSERVLRLGWVDDATRAALLRGARALVYPSRYEGFGFPVLEAMSVGVPVVATEAGGVPEVVGDAALLVPVGDHAALAAAIRTAVEDEAERTRLIETGRVRAESFSWAAHARGMAELWRTALESA